MVSNRAQLSARAWNPRGCPRVMFSEAAKLSSQDENQALPRRQPSLL